MKTGSIIKKIFIFIGVVFGLFILTAILVPILFKGKILEVVKHEMNSQLNATADFSDVDISLFRNFPRLSVSIIGLSISGKETFLGDTLISAKSIDVAVDIMKAISGKYEILNIGLNTPRIHAIVNPDGKANWDITKPTPPSTTTKESAPFALKLKKYAIENGYIEYDDRQGKMLVKIVNLNHSGSGDFTSDNFVLATKTTIDAFTFVMGNVPYLNKVKTAIDLDLVIDNKTHKYGFNTDKIQLNGLRLTTKGFVQMPDTINMNMDITFSTPSNDFKDILSLVPGMYQENFKDIKTSGKLSMNGMVKGTFSKTQMPAYQLDLAIQDGMFQYPALPQKVSDIQVKLSVNNPDGITDHTVVDLEKCHLNLGAEPFDLRLLLKTPLSDQYIDASASGKIDLGQVQQFVKLDAGTKLSGTVDAKVAVKGSMAEAQKQHYDKLDASGNISISNLVYASKDYPDGVDLYSLVLTFNPKNVTLSDFKGKYMESTFSCDGTVDNMLGYYFHNETLKGSFKFNADKIDCNKWMGTSSTPTTTTNPASAKPFLVPANLDIDAHATVGSVKYDNIIITNLQGGMAIRNQAVKLQDIGGSTLDGTFKISGIYSTEKDKNNPDIQFDYDFAAVDIKKTWDAFPTAQKMMPAGKYASGKVSSQFGLTGKLKGDMSPVLNSLTGKGNLLLLSCTMSNFPVSDQVFEKLKLSDFKSLSLKDTKIFFSFENGRVTVQPFKQKIGNIDAEIAGSNGFDQTINYAANLTVPRSALGGEANAKVNELVSQAAGKGVPVNLGDKVAVTLKITGTMTQPKVETGLKDATNNALESVKEEIKKEVTKKVDSVKTVVHDTVKAVTKQVATQAKDELKKQLNGESGKKPEDAAKDAADKAKNDLKGFFNKK